LETAKVWKLASKLKMSGKMALKSSFEEVRPGFARSDLDKNSIKKLALKNCPIF